MQMPSSIEINRYQAIFTCREVGGFEFSSLNAIFVIFSSTSRPTDTRIQFFASIRSILDIHRFSGATTDFTPPG